jgi:hypothetical protein
MIRPQQLMGTTEIGALFGVTSSRVRTWRNRHQTPVADYVIGTGKQVVHGWLPNRGDEWQLWRQLGQSGEARTPQQLLGISEIGALFGVKGNTVTIWLSRYAETHPCPVADFVIGESKPVQGWLPERADEWREWATNRPSAARRRQSLVSRAERLEKRAVDTELALANIQAELQATEGTRRA